jgi:hypothetical protein
MVELGDIFKNTVQWEIGDGSKIPAWEQSWFEAWEDMHPEQINAPQTKVADLIKESRPLWCDGGAKHDRSYLPNIKPPKPDSINILEQYTTVLIFHIIQFIFNYYNIFE